MPPSARRLRMAEILRHALLFGFRRWRGETLDTAGLDETVTRLLDLLEGRKIAFSLVGGMAMLRYVEGRNTEDLDLILTPEGLDALPEIAVRHRYRDFARARFGAVRVDLLLASNPLFREVLDRHTTPQPFDDRTIPCATVEGLILLKLYALPSLYRQGDFVRAGLYENDVATLMHAYTPAVEPLLATLAGHLGVSDGAAVRALVPSLQHRFDRVRQPGEISEEEAPPYGDFPAAPDREAWPPDQS
jgi:hypothetical protein